MEVPTPISQRYDMHALTVELLPDPANLDGRFGIDFDELASYADAFNVVMFSKNYATAWYWEMLARASKKILKKPVYTSLYVWGPGDDRGETQQQMSYSRFLFLLVERA